MVKKHGGVTAVDIFYYKQDQYELDEQIMFSEKFIELLQDKDTTLRIMKDGSRIFKTKTTITTVYMDIETKKLISKVTDSNIKTIRRYVDDTMGTLDGLPAIEHVNGRKEWYIDGELGRENGLPAIEGADGRKEWYIGGRRGRENDLPAVERADGAKMWFMGGDLGRPNNLPAVVLLDGTPSWYKAGKLYTPEGVYVAVSDVATHYYKNGKLGRDGGLPAVIYTHSLALWYSNGDLYYPSGVASIETSKVVAYYNNGRLSDFGSHAAITHKDTEEEFHYIDGKSITEELAKSIFGYTKNSAAPSRTYKA